MKIFKPTNKLRPLQLGGVQGHCLVNHFEVVGVGREARHCRPDDFQHGRPEVEVELLRGFDSRHADLLLEVEELPHEHKVVGNEGVCHQTIPEEHSPGSGGLYCQPVQSQVRIMKSWRVFSAFQFPTSNFLTANLPESFMCGRVTR